MEAAPGPAQREWGDMATRYLRPGWLATNVFNRLVAGLTRIGISVLGSRILAVRGRKSGQVADHPGEPAHP